MPFFIRRSSLRLDAIETALGSIGRALEKLADERLATPAPPSIDAATALAQAFSTVAGNQADLVKSFGDIALKTAARRMGIRGGTKRALTGARDERGKFRQMRLVDSRKPGCPLCKDPNHRDVTIPMINEHRRHSAAGTSEVPAEVVNEVSNDQNQAGDDSTGEQTARSA